MAIKALLLLFFACFVVAFWYHNQHNQVFYGSVTCLHDVNFENNFVFLGWKGWSDCNKCFRFTNVQTMTFTNCRCDSDITLASLYRCKNDFHSNDVVFLLFCNTCFVMLNFVTNQQHECADVLIKL